MLTSCKSQATLGKGSAGGTPPPPRSLSTGQDWANKSGSDGGDGYGAPRGRSALLSALIVAMIMCCGRSCWEAVCSLVKKQTPSPAQINDRGREEEEGEEGKEAGGRSSAPSLMATTVKSLIARTGSLDSFLNH